MNADELQAAIAALTLDQQCQTCRYWELPVARPGLHRCFYPQEQFIATYRHEGCRDHAPILHGARDRERERRDG